MSANPNQPSVSGLNRDIIKTGVNVPLIGPVSIGAIAIIGALFFIARRSRNKKRFITVGV